MIQLNTDQIYILGRPNFVCAELGQLLIKAGTYAGYPSESGKSEYEQAVVIHWCLNLYEEHGDMWREFIEHEINQLQEIIEGG